MGAITTVETGVADDRPSDRNIVFLEERYEISP